MADAKDAAQTEADRQRERDERVLNDLMATPQGRDWVSRFLEVCCIGQDIYRDDGDALGAAKRDGQAKIGRLFEDQLLEYCPDRYMQLIRERRGRIAQVKKQIEAEQKAEPRPRGVTPIDELADAQKIAAEEARKSQKKE